MGRDISIHIGYIAQILLLGWLATYTPLALLTTLLVHDDYGLVLKLWDGRILAYYDRKCY